MTQPEPHLAPPSAPAARGASDRRRNVLLALSGGFLVAAGLGAGVTLALQHGSAQANGAAVGAVTASADDADQSAAVGGAAADTASATVDGATLDDRFLTVLRMAGIVPSADGGSTTITDAHGVCILFDRGEAPEQVGALMMRGGMTDRQSRIFVWLLGGGVLPPIRHFGEVIRRRLLS